VTVESLDHYKAQARATCGQRHRERRRVLASVRHHRRSRPSDTRRSFTASRPPKATHHARRGVPRYSNMVGSGASYWLRLACDVVCLWRVARINRKDAAGGLAAALTLFEIAVGLLAANLCVRHDGWDADFCCFRI
jgi:hypothetical protein